MSEIITIEHIETHPNMNTWAPIRRNVLTEDDYYHSNIPYFGDEAIGSNFIKSFEENVKTRRLQRRRGRMSVHMKLAAQNGEEMLDLGPALAEAQAEETALQHAQALADAQVQAIRQAEAQAQAIPIQDAAVESADGRATREVVKDMEEVCVGTEIFQDHLPPEPCEVSSADQQHTMTTYLTRKRSPKEQA